MSLFFFYSNVIYQFCPQLNQTKEMGKSCDSANVNKYLTFYFYASLVLNIFINSFHYLLDLILFLILLFTFYYLLLTFSNSGEIYCIENYYFNFLQFYNRLICVN